MGDISLYDTLQNIIRDETKTIQVMKLFQQRERFWKLECERIAEELNRPARRGRPVKPLPDNFEKLYKQYRSHELSRMQIMQALGVSTDQFYRMVRKYKAEKTNGD